MLSLRLYVIIAVLAYFCTFTFHQTYFKHTFLIIPIEMEKRLKSYISLCVPLFSLTFSSENQDRGPIPTSTLRPSALDPQRPDVTWWVLEWKKAARAWNCTSRNETALITQSCFVPLWVLDCFSHSYSCFCYCSVNDFVLICLSCLMGLRFPVKHSLGFGHCLKFGCRVLSL